MTYLELEKETEISALEEVFRKAPVFKLTPFRESCGASSVTVSGKDEIFVGLIKAEAADPKAVWIWLVADNLTRGSALNAFDLAKKILPSKAV
jgi:aspartate-semialdehyde dehydrogenase